MTATLLVICSEGYIVDGLCRVLEDAGYMTLTAQHGAAGLALAREHSPDMVLSTLYLPDMDGTLLLELLRKDALTKNTVTILMAHEQSDHRHPIQPDEWLLGRVTPDDLLAVVAKHVRPIVPIPKPKSASESAKKFAAPPVSDNPKQLLSVHGYDLTDAYNVVLALIRHIRTQPATANTPLLYLAPRGDTQMVIEAMIAGATDTLFKPIMHIDLIAKIRGVMVGGRARSTKQTILLIDREIGAITLMGIMVERGGFEAHKARDANEALRYLQVETPDMIVLGNVPSL